MVISHTSKILESSDLSDVSSLSDLIESNGSEVLDTSQAVVSTDSINVVRLSDSQNIVTSKLVDSAKSKSSQVTETADSTVSVHSSEILGSSKLFKIPVSVDVVKSNTTVVTDSSEILNSSESAKVVDTAVSKDSESS